MSKHYDLAILRSCDHRQRHRRDDLRAGGGGHRLRVAVIDVRRLGGTCARHDLTAEQLKAAMFAYPMDASDIASML